MKSFVKEVFSRGFLIAVLVVTFIPPTYFFFLDWFIDDWDPASPSMAQSVAVSVLFSFSITVILFIGNTKLISYFERAYPWSEYWKKRLIFQSFSQLTFTVISMTALSMIFISIYPDIENPKRQLVQNIVIAVVITIIVTLIMEAKGLFQRWKQSLVESERLKKEAALAQFEALKGQLNPHFMFNSLNALSSLVYEDADKAEEFINEFSKIYRYVLKVQDVQVVKLKEEIQFLKAYIFLNKIRFEDNLTFELNMPEDRLNDQIPSLGLQTIIENCIKHNQISNESPLLVSIYIEKDLLVVKNNFNPRFNEPEGTGVGQQNLIKRYQLIGKTPPTFEKVAQSYFAKLPLIPIAK